jgi:hypothetical protein
VLLQSLGPYLANAASGRLTAAAARSVLEDAPGVSGSTDGDNRMGQAGRRDGIQPFNGSSEVYRAHAFVVLCVEVRLQWSEQGRGGGGGSGGRGEGAALATFNAQAISPSGGTA